MNTSNSTNQSFSPFKFYPPYLLCSLSISLFGLGTAPNSTFTFNTDHQYHIVDSTSSGTSIYENNFDTRASIFELRRISGLNWDQLANMFEVSKRSLHFWANGKSLSQENEVHLQQLLNTIKKIDSGLSKRNRSILLSNLGNGVTLFDLLTQKKYDQATVLAEQNISIKRPNVKLSSQSNQDRLPPSPETLIGAIHENIKTEPSKFRLARSTKVKKHGGST